jgi:hypothetical protein
MKAAIVAGCVVLSVQCAARAHADNKLPEHMLGKWCQAGVNGGANAIYYRPSFGGHRYDGCSDMDDGITLSQNGFSDDRPIDQCDEYVFDKVERLRDDTYLVTAHCEKAEKTYDPEKDDLGGTRQLQIVNDEILIVKRMPEG